MILVGIPYHQKKRYAINHLLDWLEQADLTDCEVIMRWHKGEYGEKNAVKQQREYFRKLAIEKNATHLLFIGADTIPPLDVLPRLLAHDVSVVGALYYSRHKHNGKNETPLAWRDAPNRYECLLEKGLIEVDGMGMDAVLFRRDAFVDFDYSYERNDDDWPVYRQLKAKGHKVYVDTTLVCRHYETEESYF